jgi:hypothetical protein
MAVIRTVLVVSPTPSIGQAVVSSAKRCGYHAVVVRTFAEAKQQLRTVPDLLVTELKLGEFNGLHLALRAAATETPAIIISEPAFEHEVEQLGASWISPAATLEGDEMTSLMARLVQGVGRSAASWYESDANGTSPHAFSPVNSQILH